MAKAFDYPKEAVIDYNLDNLPKELVVKKQRMRKVGDPVLFDVDLTTGKLFRVFTGNVGLIVQEMR